jgi:large subunit ribosomal protein L25
MPEITLVAEPGRLTGSAASRRMRAAGRIPAVVYGHGGAGTSVSVDGRDLRHALSGEAGLNQLLSLKVGSDTHLALARAVQRHPVRHTVLHVDFQIVRRDEVISAEVPIVLVGEARAVEQEKGLIEQLLTTLTINATPARIPPNLEVDITDLTVGTAVRVADLALPTGVTTDVPADDLVVLASLTRAAIEEEEAGAEAEEDAEGEAGPDGGAGPDSRAGTGGSATSASGEG